jgi:hypothetical protein
VGASRRSRWCLGACLAAVVGAGLLSRRHPLPGVLAEHTGDALYTVAAFFALAWLAPSVRGPTLAALAFACSAAVECAQLLPWPWLVDLRHSRLGALVLGQGFQWVDFLAYAVGALAAWAFDRGTFGRQQGIFARAPARGPDSR